MSPRRPTSNSQQIPEPGRSHQRSRSDYGVFYVSWAGSALLLSADARRLAASFLLLITPLERKLALQSLNNALADYDIPCRMMEVRDQTVFILGAGASRACGTPLTNEILWHACRNPDVKAELARDVKRLDDLRQVEDCLSEHFHVPAVNARMEDFPSLTLLLSLLDLSIDRNRPFGASKAFPNGLSREDLAKARSSIEYIIFAVLDYFLQRPSGTGQRDLLRSGLIDPKVGPQVISLNYDIIA